MRRALAILWLTSIIFCGVQIAFAQNPALVLPLGPPEVTTIQDVLLDKVDGNPVFVGGILLAGETQGDVYLIKTDRLGNLVWDMAFGESDVDETGLALAQAENGDFLIAGDRVIRTDETGTELWSEPIRGCWITEAAHGDIFVVGETDAGLYPDLSLTRLTASGDPIWTRTYGGDGIDECHSAWYLPEIDDLVIVGFYTSSNVEGDVYAVKVDGDGEVIWEDYFGGDLRDIGYDIAPAPDGGFLIAGKTQTLTSWYDLFLLKISGDGEFAWSKSFGWAGDDEGRSIIPATGGGFLISGTTEGDSGDGENILIARITDEGDSLWTTRYDNGDTELGRGIVETSETYYIAGGFDSDEGLFVRIVPAPLLYAATGPVNLLVTDPEGLQFGLDASGTFYDGISSAEYIEGETDSLIVEEPKLGLYQLEISTEDDADPTSTYSAIVRTDGTQDATISSDQPTPESGSVGSYSLIIGDDQLYINGDANGDNRINVVDGVKIVDYAFGRGPAPDPLMSADANCDLIVNITDAIYLFNFIFRVGPPPCDRAP